MEKMLSVFILVLASIMYVMAENDCNKPPECARTPFSKEAIDDYNKARVFLPSVKQVVKYCPDVIDRLKCTKTYFDDCPPEENDVVTIDIDAVIANVEEFCDTESNIHKDYSKHVDCLNSMDFLSSICFNSVSDAMDPKKFRELRKFNICPSCMHTYLMRSCAISDTEESCGVEAKQVTEEILKRVWAISKCDKATEEAYEDAKKRLTDNA